MEVLSFIFELILGRFIIRFLGLNTRYFVLKLFNKTLDKEDLLGEKDNYGSFFANDLMNAFVGFIIFFLLLYMMGIILY